MNEEDKKDGREDQEKGPENGNGEDSYEGITVYVVGLGQTGRELLYRLIQHVRVVGIDVNQEKLDIVKERAGGEGLKLVNMDATSRIAWDEAGIREDDTVVVVTRRDEVNIEVCKILKDSFKVNRLLALSHSARRTEEYSDLGIETISRARVLGAFLESRVLLDRRTALNVGQGQGEIIEVPILPGSPVVGRPLSTFHARPWLVGAVYRKDKLIVPHGRTVIKEGDRVVLIGEPHILSGIADFFKMGEPEFPLQYGPRIGMLALTRKEGIYEKVVSESNYLAQNTKATSMVILTVPGVDEPDVEAAEKVCGGTGLTCEPAYLPDEEDKAWPRQLQAQDFGCLVLGVKRLGMMKRLGLGKSLLLRVLEEADFPVLVSRGTHPYEKILVPVAGGANPMQVSELAINLARLFGSRLDAVTVTEPAFAAGKEEVEEQKRVLDRVTELSSLYRMSINIKYREGNPIKEVVDTAKDYNLVVLGHRKGMRRILPQLDLAVEILDRTTCSVMVIPYGEGEEDR